MDKPVESYFAVLVRHWKLLAVITLIPTLVALILVLFILTPVYEGNATVIFPLKQSASFMRRSLSEMDLPVSGMSRLLETTPTLYNHIAIIESRTLALRVYNYLKTEKNTDLLQTYRDILNDGRLDEEHKLRAMAKRMQKRVKVDDAERGMAEITFLHTDPVVAADVANAYISETLGFLNEVNRTTQSDLVVFLEGRQAEVEENLQTAEAEIERVKEQTGILSVEEQAAQIISSYADIETLVAQAEIDYQGSLSQAKAMEQAGMDMEAYYEWLRAGQNPEGKPPVPAIDALGDTAIAKLRSDLGDLELKRQQMMLWATPDNPDMVLLNTQIDSIGRELYREFSGYYDASVASLLVETTAYQAQLDVAKQVLGELDAKLNAFPPEERQLIELERNRDVQESIYLVITQELEQARIQEMRDEAPFTVLDEALVPTKAVRPRKLVATLGTFAIAFWAGVFAIFWVDAAARRRKPMGR